MPPWRCAGLVQLTEPTRTMSPPPRCQSRYTFACTRRGASRSPDAPPERRVNSPGSSAHRTPSSAAVAWYASAVTRRTVCIARQMHACLPRLDHLGQSLDRHRIVRIEVRRDHLEIPVETAEAAFRQPVREVQPAFAAEQTRVPTSSCALIDVSFGRYPLAQECTHRIERAVIVVLRRTGADAAQNGKDVAPVRDPRGRPVPIP